MGGGRYNFESRSTRATTDSYEKAFSEPEKVFKQQKERKAHESMLSQKAKFRESRDNAANPLTLPILFGLDVTGGMLDLPKYILTEGLPKIVSKLMERGVSPAILFTAVGDHECDKYPLQVGQFESGDAELDLWLTRTFLEAGGGGNGGESYMLPWYFAAKQTATDHWEKRGKKGFLFTIGDEPNLEQLPSKAIREVYDNADEPSYSSQQLLALAQEKWEVYHIHINHSYREAGAAWKEALGDHLITVNDVAQVVDKIIDIIVSSITEGKGGVIPATTTPTSADDITML